MPLQVLPLVPVKALPNLSRCSHGHGHVVTWAHHYVVSWSHRHVVSWSHDHVVTWSCSYMVMWLHGHIVSWSCSYIVIHGNLMALAYLWCHVGEDKCLVTHGLVLPVVPCWSHVPSVKPTGGKVTSLNWFVLFVPPPFPHPPPPLEQAKLSRGKFTYAPIRPELCP